MTSKFVMIMGQQPCACQRPMSIGISMINVFISPLYYTAHSRTLSLLFLALQKISCHNINQEALLQSSVTTGHLV
jgi:hypothetical protein